MESPSVRQLMRYRGDSYVCLKLSYDFRDGLHGGEILRYNEGIRNESKPKPFSNTVSEGRIFMRRYAWVTAVCLAVLMVSGCGNQTGQEAKQNPVSVSESTASGASEAETKSDDMVSDGDTVKEVDDGFGNDEEGKNEKGASAVKLEEGEIYRDDLDGDASEEEVSFSFEGDGKNGHDFENYKYILTLNYGENVKQFEILGGYEATWMIRTKSGDHYLYQESYHEDGLYSVTVFRVSSDEAVDLGCLDGRIGDNGIEDVNAFSWVERINLLGTYAGERNVGVGSEGLPEAKEDAWTIFWDKKPLVLKQELEVIVQNEDGSTENRVLPAGTELIPQETDKETYLDAETSDGTRCRIEVETEDGYTYMIHG